MGKKVIWVDDEHHLYEPLKNELEDEDFDVKMMEHAKEAIDNLEELSTADILIIDIRLPLKDERYGGYFLIKELKKAKIKVPILVFTALLSGGGVIDDLSKEYPILIKPASLDEFVDAVRSLCK
jgi:DNA-binding response OmpR family regulator